MGDNTYHRWMTKVDGEPLWPVARAHVRALTLAHVREPNGALQEWALIDEVLGLNDEGCEDAVAELANVRAQLLEDLQDLLSCWTFGHPDVRDQSREGGRQLIAGGGLGPDWVYPNAMTGCLARLIGSGTARVAGFRSDEDEVS